MFGDTFRWPGALGVLSILAVGMVALILMSLPAEAGKKCSGILGGSELCQNGIAAR